MTEDKHTPKSQERYYGKFRGAVVNNQDPTNRGRIQVIVRDVLGDVPVWAMPCMPYAGKNSGLFMIPETETSVWVEFEQGNISRAIWTGCFWADGELPKGVDGEQSTPPVRTIRSESGLIISLDDRDGNGIITLSHDTGENIMTIEVREGKIRLQGKTKVVVEAPEIELVENASHPVVFGDRLLTYLNQLVLAFNTHMHPPTPIPGPPPAIGPPIIPLPSPSSALLSNQVRSG